MSRWKRKGCVPGRKRIGLHLEVLEDRTLLSVNVVTSFVGLNTNDAGGQVEPPDPIGAAGPTAVVEMVNSNIAFYDKVSGNLLAPQQGLDKFFAPADPTPTLFSDVNVTYDEQAGRFFVSTMDIALDLDPTKDASYFDFAISKDSNPLDGFQFYQINTTETSAQTGEPLFTDFPRLGWNADAYVVTFNMFGFLSTFLAEAPAQYNVQILTIDKAKLLDPINPTLSVHKGSLTTNTTLWDRPVPNSTMVPATMHDSAAGDPMWFVEEKGLEQDGSYQDLRVVKMTGLLSDTPTFTDYYVPMNAYGIAPFPQDTADTLAAGTAVSFELDTRILNVDWRNNQMVLAQNVGIASDINTHARWYEISMAGGTPSMVQQGEINPGPGIDTYMPSAALAPDGTIGMTYIQSAAGVEDMSMYVTGRAPSDPSGTMQLGVKVSPAPVPGQFYNYDGSRIGDFSGITVDPSDPSTFWAVNEYAIQTDPTGLIPNWGTWIAGFTVTPVGGTTPGSISGLVFNDLNGDGLNESEPGFNGVTIEFFDSGNNLVGTSITATGSDGQAGEYSFTNLTPGTYTVVERVPSGWTATTSTSAPAVVASGTNTGGVDFGDFQLGTLSGTQFEDLTGNGFSADDPPLSSTKQVVTVNLFLNGGTTPAASTTTDTSGKYSFSNLGPGSYTVQEVVPTGWQLTAQTAATTVAASGFASTGNNFDDFQLGTLSGTQFEDLTGNGFSADDPPLSSAKQVVTINLFLNGGTTPMASTNTDTSGKYSFSDLGPGSYTVQEVVPTGWQLTAQTAATTVAASGFASTGNNFDDFQLGTLSGTQFEDLTGNGFSADDPPLSSTKQVVTINLFLNGGTAPVASTTTDTSGKYSFSNLGPGSYAVLEVVPTGWQLTAQTAATTVATSGFASTGNNFDDFQLVTISGTIFNDLNGDGTMEAGEPGLQNWVADLLKGGVLVKQLLTDASGNFTFMNLGPGTFTIQEEQEPGWLLTSTPTTYSVTTNSGVNVSGEAFGNFQTMRISGIVFNDLNGDGVQETGEPGLQGWTVDLIKGQSKATRKTDANGNFTFVGVGPGTFTVQEELQTGWMQTSTPTTYSVTTMSGTNVSGEIFGNIAPATHFSVSLPASTTAGAAFSFTITALDAFNNTAVGYQGTVTFSSSDPKRVLPANYKFTSADAGVHMFSATLRTAGSQSITATDTVTSTITGSSSMTVNPGAPFKLAIARFPFKPTAGAPGSFRVTAQDRYSNTAPTFADTVHFTSSDPQAMLPADYTFTSTDGGIHDFIATLKTAGNQSITVQDVTTPAIVPATQFNILIQPAATSQFVVSGFPPYVTAGVSYNLTVSAKDPFGNLTPSYSGTVTFTSTDLQAMLPANYTFTSGDAGVHAFAATLNTLGQQSITATDTANASINGSESMIVVFLIQPTASVSGPTLGVPGQPLAYQLDASESGLPSGTTYSYSVQWGDGSSAQSFSGSSSTQASHVYTTPGVYTITVTAADPNGDISVPVSTSVTLTTVAMETDPYDPTQTALYVGGTTGDDSIAITPATKPGGVKVGMNMVSFGSFFPTGHVVVYSQSGNDIIKTAAQAIGGVLTYVNVPVLFFAGNGNDILNASGSAANNVLVGGGGTVRLIGGQGRDILIGGAGQATLQAGAGGDILIGGMTAYDNNAAALAALLAEWGSADDYATRIADLTNTTGGKNVINGMYFFLNNGMTGPRTVFGNGLADNLYGGAGTDWFFAGMMDVLFNKTAGEVVTPL
jgi:hypothetical protein